MDFFLLLCYSTRLHTYCVKCYVKSEEFIFHSLGYMCCNKISVLQRSLCWHTNTVSWFMDSRGWKLVNAVSCFPALCRQCSKRELKPVLNRDDNLY